MSSIFGWSGSTRGFKRLALPPAPHPSLAPPQAGAVTNFSPPPTGSTASGAFPTDAPLRTHPPTPPEPPTSSKGKSLVNILLTLLLVLTGGVGIYWLLNRPDPVALTYLNFPIGNPDAMVAEGERRLAETAEADGAKLVDGAGCFFGPNQIWGVDLVCGPVFLGVSPPDKPWLRMDTSFSPSPDGDVQIGTVGDVVSTTSVDVRRLASPQGQRPPTPPDPPRYPTLGPRLADGRRIIDSEQIVTDADNYVGTSLDSNAIRVDDQTRCFFAETRDEIHQTTAVKNQLECGPVRGSSSDPDATWVSLTVDYQPGPTFGSAQAEGISSSIAIPRPLPADTVLVRPDGRTPADASGLSRPPVETDFDRVFQEQLPADGATGSPGPTGTVGDVTLTFSTVAMVQSTGAGVDSYTAAPGYQLLVADFTTDRPLGTEGLLNIDGEERDLGQVAFISTGTLLVSVPNDSRRIVLTLGRDTSSDFVLWDAGGS